MQHQQTVPAPPESNPIEGIAWSARSISRGHGAASGPAEARGVAQLGSASALGAEGRRFKSCHPDSGRIPLTDTRSTSVKSTVEKLSPTRVRINVEVPFTELQPDFDRAYKEIAKQVRMPGFRPGKAPAKLLEARIGKRGDARPGRRRRGARPVLRGGDDRRRAAARAARDRDHQEGVRRGPRVHRRGRRPARDRAPGSGWAEDHRRPHRGDRRGGRHRAAESARPLRHAQGRRTRRRERRLRLDRPVGHRRRRGGPRGRRPKGCRTRSAPVS